MNAYLCEPGVGLRRRAVVIVQVMVLLVVMFGFAAFSIDVGMLYRARAELQSAADSAALAAASSYTSDDMLKVLNGGGSSAFAVVESATSERADYFSNLNNTLGSPTQLAETDLSTGWIDVNSASSSIVTGVAPNVHNAVRVMVRREESASDDSNGPVEFFFAPILGIDMGAASASAVAAFDDRFSGYATDGNGAGVVPFSMDRDTYEDERLNGGDVYEFDDATGSVVLVADGLPEVNLFPSKVAPGNFGLLNIGTPNQGLPALADQIENGISPEDMAAEIGSAEVVFFDENGNPVTHNITGGTGMKSALRTSVETRVGQVIGFFVHDGVTGNGANAVFNIVGMRFGRLMDVKLTGNPNSRGIWLQPAIYSGGGVRIGKNSPSSNGTVGKLVLVR